MTAFSPIVTAEELGTYLGDSSVNAERANMLIEQAQLKCEAFIGTPLPPGAEVVVMGMAGDAYTGIASSRAAQLQGAGAQFGVLPRRRGGVWLSDYDKADLVAFARAAGTETNRNGAFSINPLANYVAPNMPVWDVNSTGSAVETS